MYVSPVIISKLLVNRRVMENNMEVEGILKYFVSESDARLTFLKGK